jgi:hypothetical protein
MVKNLPENRILTDQLTLSQPGGGDNAHQITTNPPPHPIFRPSYGPVSNAS